jgi:hypothetical protein
VSDAVRMDSRQPFVREHIENGDIDGLLAPLEGMRESQGLDILTITDLDGNVLLRVGNPQEKASAAPLVALATLVATKKAGISSLLIFSGEEFALEESKVADSARIDVISTAYSSPKPNRDPSAGLVAMTGSPIVGRGGGILAVLCGGNGRQHSQQPLSG